MGMWDISEAICHLEKMISAKWGNKEDKVASSKTVRSWVCLGNVHAAWTAQELQTGGGRYALTSGSFGVGGSRQKAGGCFNSTIRQPSWQKRLISHPIVRFDGVVMNCEVAAMVHRWTVGWLLEKTSQKLIKNIFRVGSIRFQHHESPWEIRIRCFQALWLLYCSPFVFIWLAACADWLIFMIRYLILSKCLLVILWIYGI